MNKLKTNFYITIFFLLIILNFQISNASEQISPELSQVKSFFKTLVTLEAKFIQVSPSGKISSGKIYLDLPGKLRIDYENPDNLLITCKGFWIVIQDRDTKTTNNVPLKNSPFSILLKDKSILNSKEFKIEVEKTSGIISLKINSLNSDTPAGLILEFTEKPFTLKKWIIQDAFNENTTVLIQDAIYNNKLSHLLFFPDDFPEPNT